ncbi:MAG TPA: sigma factor-like helix-turn-helix DNA-binding protein [Candidatus Paceibacterota bacterium]
MQLSIHPEEAVRQLYAALPNKRTRDIVDLRFGLGKKEKYTTLEAIGNKYGITRERVRQIEADALARIRKSPAAQALEGLFQEIERYFDVSGGVVKETLALEALAPQSKYQNCVHFLLHVHHGALTHAHEDDVFHSRWIHRATTEDKATRTLAHAIEELRHKGQPVSEPQFYEILGSSARAVTGITPPHAVLANWTSISKLLAKNYFNEWGLVEFPTIKPRGIRDLSYLVMSKVHKPMHFVEVARAIGDLVKKRAHVQTVHNELIKDNRFVLVGRGLYALREWGYEEGTVCETINRILQERGSLPKENIIESVLARRFVKPNTIMVNLDNRKYFRKLQDGRYTLA